jgi:hypothetical protein
MKETYYSLQEVLKGKMIPALQTTYLLRRAVKSGALQAVITNRKSGIRYSVKEEWIKDFNNKFEQGKIKEI